MISTNKLAYDSMIMGICVSMEILSISEGE